jgi:hypothetical protein
VILVILGGWIYQSETEKLPVHIKTFETVRLDGQNSQNITTKTEFSQGEPLAFQFSFEKAEKNTKISFEVVDRKSEQIVRNGIVSELYPNEHSSDGGSRFVPLIDQDNGELPSGDYLIKLKNGKREIAAHEFKII